MSEWKELKKKSLHELVLINNGIDYKSNPKGDNVIPIYGTGGIMGYTTVALNEGPAVLSGRKGSINRPFYVEGKFWNVDTIFCLKPLNGIVAKWLYYSLLNEDMTKLNEATGVPSVTSKSLYKLRINYVESNTQQKIAEILTTCDTVIEQTQAAIEKYKAIKQGMLHDLFTRGLDANGQLRPTPLQAPERYKNSELGLIPKEWEVKRLEEICVLITDGSHFSPKPLDTGKLIANVKDFQDYGINYDSCTKISVEEFNILKNQNCSPKKGDVLLSKDGTVGKVILFNDDIEIVILSSIAIIRPTPDILSKFLYMYLKSDYFNTQLGVKMSGSALKRIVLRDIKSLLVAFPLNKSEQELIFDRLVNLEFQLQSEESLLSKYQSIKKGLMKDLLSGERPLTPPDKISG
jgi:type I restriction enzyme, S subunit